MVRADPLPLSVSRFRPRLEQDTSVFNSYSESGNPGHSLTRLGRSVPLHTRLGSSSRPPPPVELPPWDPRARSTSSIRLVGLPRLLGAINRVYPHSRARRVAARSSSDLACC